MDENIHVLSFDGTPSFRLDISELSETRAVFTVEEFTRWEENLTPTESEPYLNGSIKWDGCSHVWLTGDSDTEGYYHLCGVGTWQKHCKLMEWIYKTVSGLISRMDPTEVWR